MTKRRDRRSRRLAHRSAVARGWMWAVDAIRFGPPPGRILLVSSRHLNRGEHAYRVVHGSVWDDKHWRAAAST